AAGVPLDADGRVVVGPDRRAAPDVFAIGDITPGPALAHKATAEAEVAVAAAGGRRAAFDPAPIPAVLFSDPQVPPVGVPAEDALAVEMAATVADVALTIAPHPTLSEALAEAAMGALGRPLHVRRRKETGA